jgi:subtilase family serine protease
MMNQSGKRSGVAVLQGLYGVLCPALLLFVLETPSQAQSLPTRHVSEAVISGLAQFVSPLPAAQSLRIDIVLPLSDRAGLEEFLREVYDPSSPSYRHFLTVPEFTARFGPSQGDYDAVVRYAASNGFSVVGGSRDGMDLQLEASVAVIETAFHVRMGIYRHPAENRTFYAPDREPTADLRVALWHISGLDNYSIPQPTYMKKNTTVQSNTTTGSCPSTSYCGSDLRAAYYGGTALTGSGQTLGLLEFYGYDISDVNTYFTNAMQTNSVPIDGISTDGTSLTCLYSQKCDDTEQTLDITQAVSMAPGLAALYVYVGATDTAILSSMSTHSPLSAQLSSSWTWSPSDPSTDDPYFEKFAAQGQSFFQAAGDSGKYTSSSKAVYPADDAHVTSVGGTDLSTSGPAGAWVSETVWVDGGGGYYKPDAIPIPSWQQLAGVITSANQGSTTLRNSPDVAAEANFDFYVCADQSPCTANEYGGTSFAAPMWAGYLALVNQQAVANGNPTIGFINPIIYPLSLGSGYDTDFHDITSGSNGYPAEVGYDLATGWGSPNGTGLINALAGPSMSNFTISASPTSVSLVPGSNGASTITTAVLDGFDSAIALSVNGQPTGVTVTFSPTSIAAPGSGASTMTIAAASTTTAGTYTIAITGTSGSLQHSANVTLVVTDFSISVTPGSQTVTVGSAASYTARIGALNGFTGTVTLSANGLPTGATASFTPGSVSGSGSPAVSISTSSTTSVGNYTVTITGTSGTRQHSANVTLVVNSAASGTWPNGYSYAGTITVSYLEVPSANLTNFAVLVSGTYPALATTANGGQVTNSNGYDILFTSDAAGMQPLPFERAIYSPTTGQVVFWVQVPTLSSTANTVFYVFYGNAAVTTDPSNKTGTWDSYYAGVWHLDNDAANTLVSDSSSQGNNGTAAADTNTKTTTGVVGSALSFNGSTDLVTTSVVSGKTFTWEAWVNSSVMTSGRYQSILTLAGSSYMLMDLYGGADSLWSSDGLGGATLGGTGLANNTWYHVVFVRSGDSSASGYTMYVNGVLKGQTSSGVWSSTADLTMGARLDTAGQNLDGVLDEVRVSSTVRSANWIATEYNNQSSPATFYSIVLGLTE